MKFRTAYAALLLAWPIALHPATDDASIDAIRGFDPASRAQEIRWEQQARAIPDAARIGEFIKRFSNQPHLAGTPQSKQTAEGILAQLREYGLDAHIEQFEALLPTPKVRVLEMTAPVKLRLKLEEPAIPGDPNSNDAGMIPSYNAYSGDGDVTAPLVYANYGLPADYDALTERGIDVKGKIVIVRYGGSFRGTKAKVAHERGALGCIIYSDPRDDGYFAGRRLSQRRLPPGPGRPARQHTRPASLPRRPAVPRLGLRARIEAPLSQRGANHHEDSRAPHLLRGRATASRQPHRPCRSRTLARRSAHHLSSRARFDYRPHEGRDGQLNPPALRRHCAHPWERFPDQWVLDGNHHDAWVHGASDPLSGAASLMETARTLAGLVRAGWKPRRTILLAFWDGEEFGLIGSTEWMEKHADELDRNLIAYINADSTGKGRFNIGGSHSLEAFMQEVTRDINDPVTGKPLAVALRSNQDHDFHIAALGSGSDYTPFLQHLGVAALDIRFASEDSGVYHSDYDDYNWFSHFSDTTGVYGRALSQVHSIALMRFADSPVLPFEFGRFVSTLRRYADEIDRLTPKPDLTAVRNQLTRLQSTATDLNAAYARALPNLGSAPPAKLAALNGILFRTERALALDPGLPGRPWYRHLIYAPGVYTGYAAKTLPGIREAVEAGKADEAREQAARVAQVLNTLNDQITQAALILSQL
jgi:N-acetylated-alpha-linked acidic dipeptidase